MGQSVLPSLGVQGFLWQGLDSDFKFGVGWKIQLPYFTQEGLGLRWHQNGLILGYWSNTASLGLNQKRTTVPKAGQNRPPPPRTECQGLRAAPAPLCLEQTVQLPGLAPGTARLA